MQKENKQEHQETKVGSCNKAALKMNVKMVN